MTKLNQIIAIEKGVKARTYGAITEMHKVGQKADLFNGFAKHYEKVDDASEDLPPERRVVAHAAMDMLRGFSRENSELMAVEARKDWTNCVARADVVIDGEVLIAGAPVSFLLFLEKQLTDLRTFVVALPVLDPGENWSLDPNSGLYRSEATRTHRTRKEQRALVLYPATQEHPAQTQLITEDKLAGHWVLVKHSGALPAPRKQEIAACIERVLIAVKQAREEANMQDEIESPNAGAAVFGFILGE